MIYSVKNKDDLQDLEELADLQSKVKQVRLEEKLGKQGFHYDTKQLFEPITKTIMDTNQKLLEETKYNTKAIENLDESNAQAKALELMNKNGVIDPSLIRPLAKLLIPRNKSQFKLVDDPDSENWNDFKMNGEKVTIYDDKLLFRDSGVVFTLKGDLLSMITDYDFNKKESPDAKQIINFLDEMHFNTKTTGKSTRDKTLINNYYNKRAILASGLQKVIFLSENPNELCDRLHLIIQEKQGGNDTNRFDNEIVAIIDKLLEYKSITAKQHKQILINFNLLHTKKKK